MRRKKASWTCCSDTPPPTSRKLAGSPPWSLMMSMVAMARPAPFTVRKHANISLYSKQNSKQNSDKKFKMKYFSNFCKCPKSYM